MLDLKALPILRRNLEAFINSDAVSISLVRTPKIRTDAGGLIDGPPVTLAPQRFRLVTYKRRLTDFTISTAQGEIPSLQYTLVGKYNADVQRGDEFDFNGDQYTVREIEPKTADPLRTDRRVAVLDLKVGDHHPPVDI